MADKIVLIDGHSILNRAFYGVPNLTNSEGLHTNAVYGFLNIMFKILEEEKPHNPFAVKVGASKKTLKELAQKKQENPRKPHKFSAANGQKRFAKFFKRRK